MRCAVLYVMVMLCIYVVKRSSEAFRNFPYFLYVHTSKSRRLGELLLDYSGSASSCQVPNPEEREDRRREKEKRERPGRPFVVCHASGRSLVWNAPTGSQRAAHRHSHQSIQNCKLQM